MGEATGEIIEVGAPKGSPVPPKEVELIVRMSLEDWRASGLGLYAPVRLKTPEVE